MYTERDRSQRLRREAKAIARKARKNGGVVTGHDAARLTRVRGSITKFGVEDAMERDNSCEYDDSYSY